MTLAERLEAFSKGTKGKAFRGKGPLAVALVVTEHARERGLPLKPDELLAEQKGQVLGLGKAKVQAVLARHQITRVLAEEGGRTSRGSIANMRHYVAFLNELGELANLDEIEKYWVEQVKLFFAGKPFYLKVDASESVQSVVYDLIDQAVKRQSEQPGTQFAGTVMQHLVGAKLEYLQPGKLKHHSGSTKDAARAGDFELGNVSIHVTLSPSEQLIRKCKNNLGAGLKPIIITYRDRVTVAAALAEAEGILPRVDILDFAQFMASNVHELGQFEDAGRRTHFGKILELYNKIVSESETDPSLKIEIIKWS